MGVRKRRGCACTRGADLLWLTTGLIFAVLSKVFKSSTVKLDTPIDLENMV